VALNALAEEVCGGLLAPNSIRLKGNKGEWEGLDHMMDDKMRRCYLCSVNPTQSHSMQFIKNNKKASGLKPTVIM
jgi:hypothetical protein